MTLCRWLILAIALALCSCQATSPTASLPGSTQLQPATVDPQKVVIGQTLYVPVYSHVYQGSSRNSVMNLSATLSIRNTDVENPIVITAVRYYNNNGELVRTYLESPVQLPRLASVDYFVETSDTTGGLGANFIVEWVAETAVTDPVVEALMLNTAGNQGISFISQARVLKRQGVAQ